MKPNKTKMLSAKYQESFKIAEYPLHQLIHLGRLEIHITPLNPISGRLRYLDRKYAILQGTVKTNNNLCCKDME